MLICWNFVVVYCNLHDRFTKCGRPEGMERMVIMQEKNFYRKGNKMSVGAKLRNSLLQLVK